MTTHHRSDSRGSRPRRTPATRTAAISAGVVLLWASACSTASGTATNGSSGGTTSASTASTAPGTAIAPGSTDTTGTTGPSTTVAVAVAPTTEAPPPTDAPATAVPTTASAATLPRPPRPPAPKEGRAQPPEAIALPGAPTVPNEGLWTPMGMLIDGAPAMYGTTIRANADGSVQAGIAWIDHTAVRAQLFSGTFEPGGEWSVPFNVPPDRKTSLIASFNSGFLLKEAQGGFYLEGREAVPLRDGTAAVHIDTEGLITIGVLGRDVHRGPTTAAIRQNLPLLVDGGVVAASATDQDTHVWGATLGRTPFVWRSALGVRDDGSLVYVAGPAMSARMLGNALVAAGAVRALELDINPQWVTFNTNNCNPITGECLGSKLLPTMTRSPERYLTPDDRDFFAIFTR